MNLRKPTFTDHETGARTLAANWEIRLSVNGRRRSISAFKDKAASAELGRKIERLVALRAAGQLPDQQLSRWLEGLPPNIAQRLVSSGVIDPGRVNAAKPLVEHLADWRADTEAKRTRSHARQGHNTVKKLFDDCGFRFYADIRGEAAQGALNRRRTEDRSAARTLNYALVAAKTFCNWMCRNERAQANPLQWLQGLNARTDQRRMRRALTAEECRWLLDVTTTQPERGGLSGRDRSLLYRLALSTGIRRNELVCLRAGDFDLEHATVTVQASFSKHRRQDVIPLLPEMVELLREHLANKLPAASAFSISRWARTGKIIEADLGAARKAWIEQGGNGAGDFLRFVDSAGRVADFHGLRHSFVSHLAAGGVHPKTAQTLARHSDINLTMSVYTHSLLGVERAALAKLPDLNPTQPVTEKAKAS